MAKTEAQHKAVFDFMDKDGSGEITFAEMKQSFADLKISVDDEILKKSIVALDSSGDAKISWAEYLDCMKRGGHVKE